MSGRLTALLAAGLLAACGAPRTGAGPSPATVLAEWMTGQFSSAQQAEREPDDYFDIRLAMVPIWPERTDGPWLYVEQAAASALDEPYRQRVYHLVDTEDGPRSDIYELPGRPLDWAGAWRTPERFAALRPEDLPQRLGCSIHLVHMGESFEGTTRGEGCASNLRGASYATSEVTVTRHILSSWDRGFDAEGRQVWGATAGPYVFMKEDT